MGGETKIELPLTWKGRSSENSTAVLFMFTKTDMSWVLIGEDK